MHWRRTSRSDKTGRIITEYFERRVASVEVPELPKDLLTKSVIRPLNESRGTQRVAAKKRAGLIRQLSDEGRKLGSESLVRRTANLVFAAALAAGFVISILNVGRPPLLATRIAAIATQQSWPTVWEAALGEAQKSAVKSFQGG